MVVKFSEKYGLPKDRKKLEAGMGKFSIVRIEFKLSKKSYDQRITDEEGNTTFIKKPIRIAYIDVIPEGETEIVKYYSPNGAILSACDEIIEGSKKKPDGTLGEPVFIEEVKEGKGESKNPYLFFT